MTKTDRTTTNRATTRTALAALAIALLPASGALAALPTSPSGDASLADAPLAVGTDAVQANNAVVPPFVFPRTDDRRRKAPRDTASLLDGAVEVAAKTQTRTRADVEDFADRLRRQRDDRRLNSQDRLRIRQYERRHGLRG